MSRITKEEIEKTKCGRFLLSDENIYLSIYSLNSYVFEYNLLNTEDRILYHRLQDKFDARLINGVITRVREQIIELFDKDKYIEAKVYFKPKKLSENGELEFRPLHSTGLITQIAIVSMLHLFVYASAYEMMFAYYDLVMDEGIFIEEQTYVMLMNFFAHCEKILRINLNPENWKDMKWDEIIDNQINEENKITCHLRNKIRSC